ncbi:MAG: cell division protein FtsL [Clostridia bacterium]
MKTEKIHMQELGYELRGPGGVPEETTENKVRLKVIEGRNLGRKLNAVLWIALIFAVFFTITARYGQMTNLNYEIADLKNELTAQNAVNSALRVELDKKTNIMEVRHIAETVLGMQEPDKSQIVYIDVPRANSVTVADQPAMPGAEAFDFFDYIKGFLSGGR